MPLSTIPSSENFRKPAPVAPTGTPQPKMDVDETQSHDDDTSHIDDSNKTKEPKKDPKNKNRKSRSEEKSPNKIRSRSNSHTVEKNMIKILENNEFTLPDQIKDDFRRLQAQHKAEGKNLIYFWDTLADCVVVREETQGKGSRTKSMVRGQQSFVDHGPNGSHLT